MGRRFLDLPDASRTCIETLEHIAAFHMRCTVVARPHAVDHAVKQGVSTWAFNCLTELAEFDVDAPHKRELCSWYA